MEHLRLASKTRSEHGRGAMNRLRAQGMVPAVIYGHSGSTSLTINEKEFKSLLVAKGKSAALVSVDIDGGNTFLADIVDIQRDPITDKFIHVDFHEVVQTEKMTTVVPLDFIGESVGVKISGGILDIARHEVNVRCLPANLPAIIKVDISGLDIGNIVHLSDIVVPDGVEVIGDPTTPVVSCKLVEEETAQSAEAATETTEEGATPAADAASPEAAQ